MVVANYTGEGTPLNVRTADAFYQARASERDRPGGGEGGRKAEGIASPDALPPSPRPAIRNRCRQFGVHPKRSRVRSIPAWPDTDRRSRPGRYPPRPPGGEERTPQPTWPSERVRRTATTPSLRARRPRSGPLKLGSPPCARRARGAGGSHACMPTFRASQSAMTVCAGGTFTPLLRDEPSQSSSRDEPARGR